MLPKPCKQFSKHFTDSTLEANKTTWRSCNYTYESYETIFSQRDYMLFSVVCCHKRRHFLHIRLAVLRFSFALPVAKGSGARCPKIPSTGRNHIRISILVTCNFQCNAKERQRTQLPWLLELHQAAAFAVAGQDLHLTKPHGTRIGQRMLLDQRHILILIKHVAHCHEEHACSTSACSCGSESANF